MGAANAKVVLVGAASVNFGLDTFSGLLSHLETLRGTTITLVDVDGPNLATMAAVARRANDERGAGLTIEHTTDLRAALPGADFVVVSVEVDRAPAWQKDWEIPRAHGFRHMLGENGGPGGLSHTLRTAPLVLGICRAVEELAPDALVLNYTNPMTRVCLAVARYTNVRVVGLCHQVGHAFYNIGTVMGSVTGEPYTPEGDAQAAELMGRIELQAAGLNHLTFITQLRDKRTGEDLYPAFRAALAASDPAFQPVSRRVHDVFGLYPAQGDGHIGEYLAWAWDEQGPRFEGAPERKAARRARIEAAARGEIPVEEVLDRADAFDLDRAPAIIAAILAGKTQYELAVNVVNDGCIEGLPDWAVVEVPGVVGPFGIRGVAMGELPRPIAALLRQQVEIQDRAVEAAVHGDREAALQALLLDPVTNADLERAKELLDALLAAHADHLPQFTPERSR